MTRIALIPNPKAIVIQTFALNSTAQVEVFSFTGWYVITSIKPKIKSTTSYDITIMNTATTNIYHLLFYFPA